MTTITIKRSSTASAIPLAGDLAVGELAVNLEDKRLFTKQSDGTVIELSTNPTDLDAATLRIDGVEITASATELNSLDGLTATTAELNILDGVTATATEINKLDGFTGSTAELNILDGITATTAELNTLDGVTASTTELNYTDGVTSNIQTQLNSKAATTTSPTITLAGDLSGSATLTNLGSATLTATVADDSHNHVISNVDGLQTALDSKANLSGANFTGSVDVTGTVTADGLTVDGVSKSNYSVATSSLASFESGAGVYTYTSGGIGVLSSYSSGATKGLLKLDASDLQVAKGSQKIISADGNGDVSFYEDTGTTAKMVWDSSLEGLRIGSQPNTDSALVLSQSAKDSLVRIGSLQSDSYGYNSHVRLQGRSDLGGTYYGDIIFDPDARKLHLTGQHTDVDAMVLDGPTGHVGIGTDDPSRPVEIKASTPGIRLTDTAADDIAEILAVDGDLLFRADEGNTHPNSVIRFDIDGSERMRIDSSGNVGIGRTNPSSYVTDDESLYVKGQIRVDGITNTASVPALAIDDTNSGIFSPATNTLGFSTAAAERARIDSSGNLLVGTTNNELYSSTSETGVNLTSQGGLYVAANGSALPNFNRVGSDGDIVRFRKDGSIVGSIGTYTQAGVTAIGVDGADGIFNIGGNHSTGFQFIDSFGSGQPRFRASLDNSADIGESARRFKDLYLSGGVYLGGTGAANKLDDYEEGTWTPTISDLSSGAVSLVEARYTKIGRIVHAVVRLDVTSAISSGVGQLVFTVPFTQYAAASSDVGVVTLYPSQGRDLGIVINNSSGNFTQFFASWNLTSTQSAGTDIRISLTYETNQ